MSWRSGAFLEVCDDFLITNIRRLRRWRGGTPWIERLFALTLMLMSFPLALLPIIAQRLRGNAVFFERRAILPPASKPHGFSRTHALHSLSGVTGLAARWPELWLVVVGRIRLVGNRPLSLADATALRGPAGENWLKLPAGVFSLADAEGHNGDCPVEGAAYAAWFTAHPTLRLRISIFLRCLRRLFSPGAAGSFSRQSLIHKTV